MAVSDSAITTDWSNWAGNQSVSAIEVATPRDADEVAEIVAAATERGRRVKAIGAGHSFTAIGRPEDLQIRMDDCARVRNLDLSSGQVVVEAGLTLRRLNLILAAAGRALANLGDIDVQTVAGALATGTHGTGGRFGGLATQVRGVELVTADGARRWCSPEHDPELWSAARIGLGALGIVTAVELATVPLFALTAHEAPLPLSELLEQWDDLVDRTDHFEAYWFPHTGETMTKRNTRVSLDQLAPLGARRAWFEDSFLQNTAFGALIALGRKVPSAIRPINRFAVSALGTRRFTDYSYRVFTTPRRVRFCEMEYAIPRADATAVIREVTSAVEASGLDIAFPVELRAAAADDIPLSTASGRDSAYIAVHLPAGQDFRRYFSLVASITDAAAGRPHWGKLHFLDADVLRSRYPRFDEFLAVRARVDPAGSFANAELDRVLGPVG